MRDGGRADSVRSWRISKSLITYLPPCACARTRVWEKVVVVVVVVVRARGVGD
jgi:hypothetical protein